MKARWQAISAKYAALQPREKVSVAVAVTFAVAMIGYSLWVQPAQRRLTLLQKQIVKDKADMQGLQAQIVGLKAQLRDPDEINRRSLANIRAEKESVERSLHEFDGMLVPPQRATRLLQSLFSRHRGLELVSVRTLPAQPLLVMPEPKADAKPADAKAESANAEAARGENILKHPIEIKIVGTYGDLLAYVAELEQLPQKLMWERMTLKVQAYPKSELTLVVSTLSLDSVWLVF